MNPAQREWVELSDVQVEAWVALENLAPDMLAHFEQRAAEGSRSAAAVLKRRIKEVLGAGAAAALMEVAKEG